MAGFTLEEMIGLLNAGVTVENLLYLIDRRLSEEPPVPCSSRWII
jgi:hypothetical protein